MREPEMVGPEAALVRLAAVTLSPRHPTALNADGFAPIPVVRGTRDRYWLPRPLM
jgi:hypothetical protein